MPIWLCIMQANTIGLQADGQCVCMAGMQGMLTTAAEGCVMTSCVLLHAGEAEAWAGPEMAVDCLIAAVSAAPAVVRAHQKLLQKYAYSVLMDDGCSILARQNASHLLSLLPSVTGR